MTSLLLRTNQALPTENLYDHSDHTSIRSNIDEHLGMEAANAYVFLVSRIYELKIIMKNIMKKI